MLRSSLFLTLAALVGVTMAGPDPAGFACGGSSNCQFIEIDNIGQFGESPNNQIPALASLIVNGVDDNRLYQNGEHIACLNGKVVGFFPGAICAFLQKTSGGVLGSDIKNLASALAPNCGSCGSVATGFFGGDLNVNDGELTVNAVTKPNCNGVC